MKLARMIQVVFEGQRQKILHNTFIPRFSNKTLKDDQFLHHITLFYGGSKPVDIETDKWGSLINEWAKEGEDVFVYLEELVWSDVLGVEAITVTLKNSNSVILESLPNKVYHITVSTEGKLPSESNTLLNSRNDPKLCVESQELKGIKLMGIIKHI